jgi:hypothetical protein
MSSQIDVTKPTTGTATTQSVRDNFSSTVSDIEALQGESSILGVAASVAANALTVSLKTSAGIDATSTTGIEVSFRNATASTGTRTVISAQAAISVVAPQGATLGFANSATDNIYAYAINNAGTVELAISASLFDEGTLQSTTAISATADSATVLYSTTARTSVGVRLLGRVKITTGATAGDWSQAPTEIHASNNFHNIIGQDVQAFDATIVVDADIGVTVQAHDADTAKTDVAQTFTADQSHGDNVKAKFGSSDDLQIYHDGATSNIVDTGTGNLSIRGSNSVSISDLAGYKFINCVDEGNGGYVLLNHQNNAEKLRTTSTGIDVTGTVNAEDINVSKSDDARLVLTDTGDSSTFMIRSDGVNTSIGTDTAHPVRIMTNNAERMRIDSSGNVGIGTASPDARLDIEHASLGQAANLGEMRSKAGFILNSDTDFGSNALTMGESAGTAGSYFIAVTNSAGSGSYPLNLQPYGGNVGIGTNSPTYALHVKSPATTTVLIDSAGAGYDSQLRFEEDGVFKGATGFDTSLGVVYLNRHGNGTQGLVVDSSGNVGIGTQSPAVNLHINKGSSTHQPAAGVIKNYVAINTDYNAEGVQGIYFLYLL